MHGRTGNLFPRWLDAYYLSRTYTLGCLCTASSIHCNPVQLRGTMFYKDRYPEPYASDLRWQGLRVWYTPLRCSLSSLLSGGLWWTLVRGNNPRPCNQTLDSMGLRHFEQPSVEELHGRTGNLFPRWLDAYYLSRTYTLGCLCTASSIHCNPVQLRGTMFYKDRYPEPYASDLRWQGLRVWYTPLRCSLSSLLSGGL